ncbi:hypothetical protein [Desulfobacter sp.]|uniref:hypothetical protein n=1 Tax=Desulfobacter sp. TaxID=2294 RepID=UPI003D13EC52
MGIDLATPVVESIGAERKSKFTETIFKVTVEKRDMKKAEKAGEHTVRNAFVHKKAMAD